MGDLVFNLNLSPATVEDMDSDVNIVTNNYIGRFEKNLS